MEFCNSCKWYLQMLVASWFSSSSSSIACPQVLLQLSHARLRLLQTLLTQNRHAAQSAWNTMTKPRNLIDCRQLCSIQESKIERSYIKFVICIKTQTENENCDELLMGYQRLHFSLQMFLVFFSVLVFCVDGVSIYSLFSNVPQFYSFYFCHA